MVVGRVGGWEKKKKGGKGGDVAWFSHRELDIGAFSSFVRIGVLHISFTGLVVIHHHHHHSGIRSLSFSFLIVFFPPITSRGNLGIILSICHRIHGNSFFYPFPFDGGDGDGLFTKSR